MLSIRDEQLVQMNQLRAAAYHRQLLRFYRDNTAELVVRFDDQELNQRIAEATERARKWRIGSAEGILQFVGLALAAGRPFDEDPKVHDFLALPGHTTDQKIRRLIELVAMNLRNPHRGASS